MNIDRIRWQGASRQRQLLDRLQAELDLWAAEWSTHASSFALAPVAGSPATGRWLRLAGKRGAVWLAGNEAQLRSFGAAIAAAEADDTLDWSGRIGRRALHALLARLLGVDAASHPLVDAIAPPERTLEPRYGMLLLRLTGPGLDACIALDGNACDAWLPPAAPAPLALAAVGDSFADATVVLDVVLPLGSASLADTHGLQVGDVLVSDVPLDTPFDLVHPDQRRIARARLCRRDDQLALVLESA
jgi:hypothetical protein